MEYLADANVIQPVVDLLRSMNMDVLTAQEAGVAFKTQDYLLLQHARLSGRVWITFDYLQKEEGARVARELRMNGGKILQIRGGPEQDPRRAAGKVLYHWTAWHGELEAQDGLYRLSDLRGTRFFTPGQFLQTAFPNGARQFEEYLARMAGLKAAAQKATPPHAPIIPKGQMEMDLGSETYQSGLVPKFKVEP